LLVMKVAKSGKAANNSNSTTETIFEIEIM
jgi:hypothetical protein